MSYVDTLFANRHNIRTLDGITVVGQIQHWAPGDLRGDDDEILGRHGSIGAVLPRAKFLITVPIQVKGVNRGQRNDRLLAAIALISGTENNPLIPLRRRIATGSGDSYREHFANGRFNGGAAMTLLNPYTGRCELQFYNLSGAWWTGSRYIIP